MKSTLFATTLLAGLLSAAYGASMVERNPLMRRAGLIMYCRFQNFKGSLCQVDIQKPDDCMELPVTYINGVESIAISENVVCDFFQSSDCTGASLHVEGVILPVVPEQWIASLGSYSCDVRNFTSPTPSPVAPVQQHPITATAASTVAPTATAASPGGSA